MATFTNQSKNSTSFSNLDKIASTFSNLIKNRLTGLVTEDLLNFLTTEDDEVLLVEPVAGGIYYTNQNKV